MKSNDVDDDGGDGYGSLTTEGATPCFSPIVLKRVCWFNTIGCLTLVVVPVVIVEVSDWKMAQIPPLLL